MQDIAKVYEPQKVEDAIYKRWETSGFFNPDNLEQRKEKREKSLWRSIISVLSSQSSVLESFTIVMPPPNVTGTLHVGHAVMLALEDIMIRFERMRGKRALWVPGTDHAAIATQAVVEKKLVKGGMENPRKTMGREKFLKEVEAFAATSHDRITTQIRKMGASCDWSREAYTLDEARSRAVQTAFITMYDDGLIYRGNRTVNWCPRCKSTLADDEVEYREERTPFYYFKYGPVVIGTARPETKFADKTLVVHPDDERYKHLIGKEFEVPWIGETLKSNVIADEVIDPKFGTGAMTITPAHSFDDFALAQKHGLPVVSIIDEDGNLTEAAGAFHGKNARESRDAIVKVLADKGLVDHVDENYVHNLTLCYRCATPVEPLVSKQWFVAVDKKPKSGGKSLKDRARDVVRNGEIKIIPDRFNKTYFQWMNNLHDWCVSRQIWFGHRIPVWYHESKCVPRKGREHEMKKCKEFVVAAEEPRCEFCDADFVQDADTLDTWFSSGLWTFSTLGWSEKTVDLKTFHPTSVLETGYDILFFWIARMIMMTTYHMNEVPFRTVYLHGLVRDEQGRKMSKSLGNVIDPLDMTEKYGADATRLSFVIGTAPGNDVKLSEAKIAGFRNFTNKLWNIARYILIATDDVAVPSEEPKPETLADRWILGELNRVTVAVTEKLERYEFSPAGEMLRDFTWGSLADWYLEIAKCQVSSVKCQVSTKEILRHCLDCVLRLWHPFMPFVTEVVWEKMGRKNFLMVAPWPRASGAQDRTVQERFAKLQEVIGAIRNIRASYGVEPGKPVEVTIAAGEETAWLEGQSGVIKHLARVGKLTVAANAPKPEQVAGAVVGNWQISVPLAGLIDIEKERGRIKKHIDEISSYIYTIKQKLENKEFARRAPRAVVVAEQEKLATAEAGLTTLQEQLRSLG